jgi:hypothetical protein
MMASVMRARLLRTRAAALALLGVAIYVALVIEADFNFVNSALFPLAFLTVPFGLAYLNCAVGPPPGALSLRCWPRG